MRILTDCPEQVTDSALPVSAWTRTSMDLLSDEEQVLWQTLGSEASLWTGAAAPTAVSSFWARAVIVAEAPSSQFDALNELFRRGLKLSGPMACVALQGFNFRGLRGRNWAAVPGNLHLTAAFQPADFPARHALALTMLPAVAVVDAVRTVTGGAVNPGIKWVNDILVNGRKIAGVITTTQVRADKITHVTLGIGLNVAQTPDVPPTPFVPAVGSLADAGARTTMTAALASVLWQLARYYDGLARQGPDELVAAYRSASLVIGKEVCIWDEAAFEFYPGAAVPPPLVRGIVRNIAPDLSLRLEGIAEPVRKGRLAFAENIPDNPPAQFTD
jgi:BirA family biotin operon repressor/biotin-[acetyl-CoA-carboxylase] ligase